MRVQAVVEEGLLVRVQAGCSLLQKYLIKFTSYKKVIFVKKDFVKRGSTVQDQINIM